MSRLSPRIYKKIHTTITGPDGKARPGFVKNIGLNGAYLVSNKLYSSSRDNPTAFYNIRISPSGKDDLALTARVVWRKDHGLGLRFSGISKGELLKIWHFIREYLVKDKTCPYCGILSNSLNGTCPQCGWELNFQDRDYLSYWEREYIIRRLYGRLQDLSSDALREVSQFFHKEVFPKERQAMVEESDGFVGRCQKMEKVFSLIRKVAPTELPVLILGESGTGKELSARAIHEASLRKDNPFVAINCAAIPETLLEAELFGYEKEAFTGAYQAKKGKFEHADQGTLFLDEIAELPRSLQPKLLRFLENQMIERIGSLRSKRVDVRIIAATNGELEKAVANGEFRSDLYYRIKVFTINLPPLRERAEDKVTLANYFFKKITQQEGWRCKGFTPEALECIRQHPWPGNVRELSNRIRRAVVVQEDWIRPEDLEITRSHSLTKNLPFRMATQKLKRDMIESALREHKYNVSQTARSLGMSRPYLYTITKKLGIQISRR